MAPPAFLRLVAPTGPSCFLTTSFGNPFPLGSSPGLGRTPKSVFLNQPKRAPTGSSFLVCRSNIMKPDSKYDDDDDEDPKDVHGNGNSALTEFIKSLAEEMKKKQVSGTMNKCGTKEDDAALNVKVDMSVSGDMFNLDEIKAEIKDGVLHVMIHKLKDVGKDDTPVQN